MKLEENICSTWVRMKKCTENETDGGRLNTSPKVLNSFNDCELCAGRGELDFTPSPKLVLPASWMRRRCPQSFDTETSSPDIHCKGNAFTTGTQSEIDFDQADNELSASAPAGPNHITPVPM